LVLAGALLAFLVLACSPSTQAVAPTPESTSTSTTLSATTTTSTSTTEPSTTTTSLVSALEPGSTDPGVAALQQKLVELGFWLPAVDGEYASDTTHAVVAFQKANGITPDGVAGPLTISALDLAERPIARSITASGLEVDLTRQLLLVVTEGQVQWVFDTSTGRRAGTTPVGDYTVLRQVDGYDRGPLGVLYRPKYFVGGVAVHGYPSVPSHPASHGCVRVTNAAMDWLWANDAMPKGTNVSVYE
jgi:peptidoglycan hydrolase-like protein with peptidoglycan-binding domain